jgi:hypothetical protein
MCPFAVQALVHTCSFIAVVLVDLVSAFLHSAVQTCPLSPQFECELAVEFLLVSVLAVDFVLLGVVCAPAAKEIPATMATVKMIFFIFRFFNGLYLIVVDRLKTLHKK